MAPEKRARSQWGDDERAEVGREARRTPARGVDLAAPVAVEDEDSTTYDIPERAAVRDRKPTPHRIRKLEAFKDDMLERFPVVEANVKQLVDWKVEERKQAAERRAWWRAVGLIVAKGAFSGTVIVAVLRAVGIL